MGKHLTVTHNGKEYTLEYTRRTVQRMEQNGFVVKDIEEKPVSTLPKLFAGAFLANHQFVRQNEIDEIYKDLDNKPELIAKLAEMYSEPIAALVEGPGEGDSGNASWTADW